MSEKDVNESSRWEENRTYGWWRSQYKTLQEQRRKKALEAIEAAQKTAPESVQSDPVNPHSVRGQEILFPRKPRKTEDKRDLKKGGDRKWD